MNRVTLDFASPVLGMRLSLEAYLPDRVGGPLATLYLLHGNSDDHTVWGRLTRLESRVGALPLAVVVPQGFRGFWTNHSDGPRYADYLVDDVIGIAERTFPLRRERAGRAVGGNSMGGYGAVRLGLARPELFASVHSHSGAMLYGGGRFPADSSLSADEQRRIFGASPAGTAHDCEHLARRLAASDAARPALRLDCGVDDWLLDQNRSFHATLDAVGIAHEYAEFPGAHDWDYWDARLAGTIAFHARALGIDATAPHG